MLNVFEALQGCFVRAQAKCDAKHDSRLDDEKKKTVLSKYVPKDWDLHKKVEYEIRFIHEVLKLPKQCQLKAKYYTDIVDRCATALEGILAQVDTSKRKPGGKKAAPSWGIDHNENTFAVGPEQIVSIPTILSQVVVCVTNHPDAKRECPFCDLVIDKDYIAYVEHAQITTRGNAQRVTGMGMHLMRQHKFLVLTVDYNDPRRIEKLSLVDIFNLLGIKTLKQLQKSYEASTAAAAGSSSSA
jgi:hypothetical protein